MLHHWFYVVAPHINLQAIHAVRQMDERRFGRRARRCRQPETLRCRVL